MRNKAKSLQREVQQLIDGAIADGAESAVQVAVYLKGVLVVDARGAPKGKMGGTFTTQLIEAVRRGVGG